MNNDVIIKVEKVDKVFKLPHEKYSSLKSALLHFFRSSGYETQHVLNDLSFEVKRGEFLGIVGRNGSGKSTLLKLLAGIYEPNGGSLTVNGSLTPFIELGVGFNPELTGRENVFLNGALLGFSRKEMDAMYNDIVEFAELSRFMDQKLKNYSSGMQVRLAFSIAIRSNTDILLIDEVLAVGDALFQQKCYDYFDKLKKSDKTVIFISHDMGAVQSFCDRAILIDKSKKIIEGNTQEVVSKYNEILSEASSKTKDYQQKKYQHIGVGGAEITGVKLLNHQGKVCTKIEEGEDFTVRLQFAADKDISDPVIGVGIMSLTGDSLIGPNTKDSDFKISKLPKNGEVEVTFKGVPLATGDYKIRAGIFNTSNTVPYDFVEDLMKITVVGKKRYSHFLADTSWTITEKTKG